jgi:histidinol-phosphate aminotransferase
VAGIAALEDEEHVARSCAHTEASRTFFMRELANLGLQPIPSQTNFLAFEVGDDAAVTDGLFAKGFTITPLSGWGLPGYIRISFGTMAQNEQFMLALESVLATVGQK